MYHIKRTDRTIESALVEVLRVPVTDHCYALTQKNSGDVRGLYNSAAAARAAGPDLPGLKGAYRVTAVHPVVCNCSPMDRVMDGED